MSDERFIATKDDWETSPMPSQNASFILKRQFTSAEMDHLKAGHIPGEMEDRWFSYFEDNKLYIHRSWSGICIYIVEFDYKPHWLFKSKRHRVLVNRDQNQYACTDLNEDISQLNSLLDYFVL